MSTVLNILIIITVVVVLLCILRTEMRYCDVYLNTPAKDNMEHYDLEVQDVSVVECGTKCTEGLNCAGFAYKPSEAKCYLSKSAILGSPMESLYSDSYSKLDRRCNKINRITDDKRIDGNTLTANSIYICSDGESNTATQFQYANLGGTALESVRTTLFDRADSDIKTPANVQYDAYDIVWPTTKPPETLDQWPSATLNQKDKLLASNANPNTFGFVESNNEFLGQYMLAHQCVANTSLFDCLKYCEDSPNCAGTEWNKALIKTSSDGKQDYLYENVCCPKSVIKQIIPRRNKLDRGKFYVKKQLKDMIGTDKVIFTKSPTQKVPMNNRFSLKMTEFDQVGFNTDGTTQNVDYVEGVSEFGNT